MNDRQRVLSAMRYEPVDKPPLHLVKPWYDTLERWYGEGLPRGSDVHELLGLRSYEVRNISCNTALYPVIEERIISEDGDFVTALDEYGRTTRGFKSHTSLPEWVSFPVNSADDLRVFLDEHYDVSDLDARFPHDWEENVRLAQESGAVVLIDGGCYYWTLRSIAGVEQASYLLHDAPDLVEELFERYCTVVMEGISRASKLGQIDAIGCGEDIAFKTGTLMSPAMFRKLIYPRYKRAMDLAHSIGVEFGWMDSDGDLRELIPDYLDLGINIVAPCEVAASMAPVELRKSFGRDLRMTGGIDKREIAKGRAAIDAEIERNRPVIEDGGYLPSIDHSISSDISFGDYCYFIEKLVGVL